MKTISLVDDKRMWERFLLSQPRQPFLQSWNWGEVQKELGYKIFRFGLFDKGNLAGVCLTTAIKAKRGRYFRARHGPVLTHFAAQFDTFFAKIKEQAKEEGVDVIRISPLLEEKTFDMVFLRTRGFKNVPVYNMDSESSWFLDLDKSEEELLADMRKTTRYLVKKAQALPIEITVSTDKRDFDAFMKLYEQTSKRHRFIPHPGSKEEFAIFAKDNQAKLFLAKYKNKLLAGALIVFYGDSAIYHHGASSDEYRDIPAAYLLQWEAICEAKRQGKKVYNFWGVVPPDKPNHPWQGLTLFKTGFGGRPVNFIHAQDFPLTPGYWKIFASETIWRIYRRY